MHYYRTLKNQTVNDQVNSFDYLDSQELYLQIATDNEKDTFQHVLVTGDEYSAECELAFLSEEGTMEDTMIVSWQWRDTNMFHANIYKGGEDSSEEVTPNEVFIQKLGEIGTGHTVSYGGMDYTVRCLSPAQYQASKFMKEKEKPDLSKFMLSPMPGRVVSTHVEAGAKVEEGEKVLVLEAMKMQNVLRAEKAGVIKAIHVQTDDQVADDEILIEWE